MIKVIKFILKYKIIIVHIKIKFDFLIKYSQFKKMTCDIK